MNTLTVSEYKNLVLKELPPGTKVNFDVAVKITKNKAGEQNAIVGDTYLSDKVKFSVTKPKEEQDEEKS